MRPVRHTLVEPPTLGAQLTFQLLHRQAHSGLQLAGQPAGAGSGKVIPRGGPAMGSPGARFAKFGTASLGDALALWREVARALAGYAEELTREGGWEAASQAPAVFAALDTLAVRARRWAQYR